jgi:hypothetical protein
MLFPTQSLRQHIGHLFSCWQVLKTDLPPFNDLAQEMIPDLNVFGLIVKLGIPCDRNGRLVIDVDGSRGGDVESELGE